MGDPVTTALIIGATTQAYGSYTGAQSAKASYKAQEKISRQNAVIIGEQIKDVKTLGKRGARQIERETVEFAGDQVTQFASSGIDISSAVVSETLEQTARTGAADVIELLNNVKKDVWGLEMGKMSAIAQANLDKYNARATARAANIALAGSALSIYGSTLKPNVNPLARTSPRGTGLMGVNRNVAVNYPRMGQ